MKQQESFGLSPEARERQVRHTGGPDGDGIANTFQLTATFLIIKFSLNLKVFRNTAKFGSMANMSEIIKEVTAPLILISPDFINTGGDNLIAVAVSYLQKDEFKMHPVSEGDFNVSCGIYRDVRLVLNNKLFIPMQGSAIHEGGTLITTPGVSEKEGIVNIKTWVKNDYPQSRTCILQTSISDRNGQVIQIIKTEMVINAGQLHMFGQTSKPVKNPHLWSVEDPYLYTINSEVIDKKDVVDACTSSFGFRWLSIDEKNNTFYLNDKKIELKGVNRHQEYPWLGDAVPGWITELDYSEISGKEGRNFIRAINYPGDELSYKQADEHGILTEAGFSAVTSMVFPRKSRNSRSGR